VTARLWVLLPVLLAAAPPSAALQLEQVGALDAGTWSVTGRVVCADTDHDSLVEVIANTGRTFDPQDPLRWEVWEYRPVNRWVLAYADTGSYPLPQGETVVGNFSPFAAGDIDRDGLADLVGTIPLDVGDSTIMLASVIESASPDSHPRRLAWTASIGMAFPSFYAYTDLDQDGRNEIFVERTRVFESRGNDSLVPIPMPPIDWAFTFAFGDFDRDGLREFATGFFDVSVYENCEVGRDTYALTYVDQHTMGNGYDIFSGNDVDSDGRDEFFICYRRYSGEARPVSLSLWMWEASGNNTFERSLVANASGPDPGTGRSQCGDLDGDGIEEIAWVSTGQTLVYKATGNNQFDLVSTVGLPGDYEHAARIVDANRNGYNELLLAGNRQMRLFEVEAIRVLSPNGGSLASGDTCTIRWRTYSPPRCDSISLFLLTDTVIPQQSRLWQMDTIVHGLPPGDTTYRWVVPDTVLAPVWVVAMAYGPGWQFDRSDSSISIVPAGLEEVPAMTRPRVEPTLSGNVLFLPEHDGRQDDVLLDATGRKVLSLHPGPNDLGDLPSGVYFYRVDAPGLKDTKKAVITK